MPKTLRTPRRSEPTLEALLDEHQMILLFDGDCGLCHRAVQWVLARDPDGPMRFAALSSRTGQTALRRLAAMEKVDSMILLHRDGAWIKSTAALELARYVGGGWALATVGYLIPRVVRDGVYDWIARRRTAIAGACDLHTSSRNERLLD